jgi:hypothetical protein
MKENYKKEWAEVIFKIDRPDRRFLTQKTNYDNLNSNLCREFQIHSLDQKVRDMFSILLKYDYKSIQLLLLLHDLLLWIFLKKEQNQTLK